MTRIQAFRAFRTALREGRLGDAALLKAEAFGGGQVSRETTARLLALGAFPDVDPGPLRLLPRGSLGREYVELLDANGLTPFRVSPQIDPALLERHVFVARYSLVHDAVHVLTGFDTSWAGELGVWSFIAAQRYSPAHFIAVALACILYPLYDVRQIPRLWRNLRLGFRMGRRARPVLFVPYDRQWGRSVAELRTELQIEPSTELQVVTRIVGTPSPA